MSTVRKQLRKNLLSILKGRTSAKECVFFNKSRLNWQEHLPIINLYFRGEPTIEERSQAPREMRRNIQLEVEIIVDGTDENDASDKLDDLCEEVETLLALDDSLGKCADDIILQSVSDMEGVSDGSKETQSTKLIYLVKYTTFAPREGSQNFEDFNTVTGEWNLQPEQEIGDRANDTVNLNP